MFVIEQKNSGKKKTGEKPNIEIEKTFRKKKKQTNTAPFLLLRHL